MLPSSKIRIRQQITLFRLDSFFLPLPLTSNSLIFFSSIAQDQNDITSWKWWEREKNEWRKSSFLHRWYNGTHNEDAILIWLTWWLKWRVIEEEEVVRKEERKRGGRERERTIHSPLPPRSFLQILILSSISLFNHFKPRQNDWE